MNDKQTIVFDLDDTLIDTSHVYWTARKAFIDVMVAQGLDGRSILEVFEKIDEKNIKTFGFHPTRYGHTMIDVYRILSRSRLLRENSVLEEKIRACGQIITTRFPELIDGAEELLKWASKKYSLILLTRGVEDIQHKKLAHCRIAHYFETIRVVAAKDARAFQQAVKESGVHPDSAWVIGDSIRSDINPAIEAGIKCILYVYSHHSYYWRQEYGVIPIQPFYKIGALNEAITLLENPSAIKMTSPSEWVDQLAAQPLQTKEDY
jgi:putative hydrolase of the HAD superfamily